jgi:hypothetical protein
MEKTFMTLFLLSVCSLAVAVAQAPDQPQTDQQTAPSSSTMGKNLTMTGCLQAGTEPNTYVLFNATPSDMNQSSRNDEIYDQSQSRRDIDSQRHAEDRTPDDQNLQSQSGTMPSEMARTENSYTLIPDGRVDFKSHVGQRVEVTGKISETTARTNQSSKATTPAGQSSSIHSSTEMTGQPQLRVSSIRQISQTCQ